MDRKPLDQIFASKSPQQTGLDEIFKGPQTGIPSKRTVGELFESLVGELGNDHLFDEITR